MFTFLQAKEMSRQYNIRFFEKMFYRHSVGSYERIMPRNAFWLWSIFSVTETEILSKKTPNKHDIRH